MDRYILAKCKQAVKTIKKSLDAYDTPAACDAVSQFFEALNNWYIRRNKERFWSEIKEDADPASPDGLRRTSKQAAYDTLYTVLTTMCRAAAPLLPLTLEEVYRGLVIPLPPGEGAERSEAGEGKKYAPKKLIENARALRKNSTDVEGLLWNILRDRQLENKKFRRQHPIGNYILDFYCEEDKLAIELDGGQHAEQQTYDDKRTAFLNTQGIKVLRFWNNDVLENIEGVVEAILNELQPSPASPANAGSAPSPGGRGIVSVHLADFPDVSKFPEEGELLSLMDRTRDVCNAALAIRNKLNIRIRQPLREIWLVEDRAYFVKDTQLSDMVNIIKDEVNVEEYKAKRSKDFADYRLHINSAVLGKRLPEKMKQILAAAKKGEWEHVIGTGVKIAGEILTPPLEYSILLEPKPEFKNRAHVLSTNDALVILDINLDDNLINKGIARDLVRMIQQARKDAGLHVSDRIALSLDAAEAVAKAAKAHDGYIREQTLAATLTFEKPAKAAFTAENTLDEHKVIIALSKCA